MHAQIVKLANKHIRKTANKEYDILCRLQVLEGVANIPHRHWSDGGIRGLAKASKFFAERGLTINPDWLTSTDTKMFGFILNNLRSMLVKARLWNKARLDQDMALEVFHHYLMGIGKDVDSSHKPILHEVGKYFADRISSGDETPETIRKNIWFFMSRKVLNLIKMDHKDVSDSDAGQLSLKEEPGREGASVLLEAIRSKSDPLGIDIRNILLNSVPEGTTQEKIMQLFVSSLVERGDFLPRKEMADYLGIESSTLSKFWKKAWEKVYHTVKENPLILREIEDRYLQEGISNYQLEIPSSFEAALELSKQAFLRKVIRRIASFKLSRS